MRLFERLHERGQHHHPRHPRARHRRARPPHHPHPRRQDRERRAEARRERLRPMPVLRSHFASPSRRSASNKLRSFLTVLGILIGVSSVIAVVAITEGLDRYIAEQGPGAGHARASRVQKMPDIITSREQWIEMQQAQGHRPAATSSAVKRGCDAVQRGGRAWSRPRAARQVRPHHARTNVADHGRHRELQPHRHHPRAHGRPPASSRTTSSRRGTVAVIGTDLVDAFFGPMEPLGKEILDRRPPGHGGRASPRRRAASSARARTTSSGCPITTFRKFYGIAALRHHPGRGARPWRCFEEAQDQARVAMRVRRHLDFGKPDDFAIETGESIMDLWQSATRGIYVVTIVVTAISLLVGGDRGHEHHAGLGHRAHPRDRRAQGARRPPPRHPAPVPGRVGDPLGVRRRCSASSGAAVFSMGLAIVLGGIMSANFTRARAPLGGAVGGLRVHARSASWPGSIPASRAAALDPVVALRNE